MLGVTAKATAPALLQYGPTCVIVGVTGFKTLIAIVLVSGHKVAFGVDAVL